MDLDLSAYDVPSSPLPAEPAAAAIVQDQPGTETFESLGVEELGVDEAVTAGATRRPRAKFDSDRMLSERGLPALRKIMKKMKFKGKGYEKRDLSKLLGTYQLWGHKLYAKANFEDFLALCRRAGQDPAVKNYRRRVIDEEKYPHRFETEVPAEPTEPTGFMEPLDAPAEHAPTSAEHAASAGPTSVSDIPEASAENGIPGLGSGQTRNTEEPTLEELESMQAIDAGQGARSLFMSDSEDDFDLQPKPAQKPTQEPAQEPEPEQEEPDFDPEAYAEAMGAYQDLGF